MKSLFNRALSSLEKRAFPEDVFGGRPQADEATYQSLYSEAKARQFPETDELEEELGFSVDRDWINELALHTQVVRKKSRLNWQHGRILYSLLRSHIETTQTESDSIQVFETGTARGFSALCMSKAILDSKRGGFVVTVDSLPHNTPMFWNCIDDLEKPKSRRELLAPWEKEVQRVIFLQSLTPQHLGRLGLEHIHFAFLDAQHSFETVMDEYSFVEERQDVGDLIVFDDVTPGVFDGVVEALDAIGRKGLYEIRQLGRANERGYAVARRLGN